MPLPIKSRCIFSNETMSSIPSRQLVLMSCILLSTILIHLSLGTPHSQAADIRYVKSPEVDLNVRRGPGTDHPIIARLPHRTQLSVEERVGLWLRITTANAGVKGWVLQRYLVLQPPADLADLANFDPEKEQERFDRLKRQNIIRVRPDNSRGVLQIWINGLIWDRLTPHQQANFLRRAHRLYNMTKVELRDRRTNKLCLRLLVIGEDNLKFDFISSVTDVPDIQSQR